MSIMASQVKEGCRDVSGTNWNGRGEGTGLISAARSESEAFLRWALGWGPSQLPRDPRDPSYADLVPVQAPPAQEEGVPTGRVYWKRHGREASRPIQNPLTSCPLTCRHSVLYAPKEVGTIIPFYSCERHKEVKYLAQGHTIWRWQSPAEKPPGSGRLGLSPRQCSRSWGLAASH